MGEFRLDRVSKSYAGVEVVAGLSLAFTAHATSVLVGPSGCGKSTVLKLLLGLTAADEGTVTFEGTPVSGANVTAVRRRVGYVIQNGGLFPHMTARQNVALAALHNDIDVAARIADLAALVRLEHHQLDKYPAELSGGQRQRVALMRALVHDPDVLLLDEPFGALDTIVRHDLQQEMRDIFQSLDKTVVMVTHDMGEAAYFADHIVLMHRGRIVQRGVVEDLLQHPADSFVTRFLTSQRDIGTALSERDAGRASS